MSDINWPELPEGHRWRVNLDSRANIDIFIEAHYSDGWNGNAWDEVAMDTVRYRNQVQAAVDDIAKRFNEAQDIIGIFGENNE